MKCRLLFFTFNFFCCISLMAQNPNQKTWEEGKLNWSDFQEINKGANEVTEIIGASGVRREKFKQNDTIMLRFKAYGYMDRNRSWVHPQHKTEPVLRYNQLVFDIMELYRRKLQVYLNTTLDPVIAQERYNFINEQHAMRATRFQTETQNGQDLDKLAYWEMVIKSELSQLPPDKIPAFEKRNFGIGVHAGISAGVLTGSLGQHFSNPVGFMYGFDLAYKNSLFLIAATLSGNKVTKAFMVNEPWNDNQKTGFALIELAYGYAFIDNAKIKITPFAGLGITEESINLKDPDLDNPRLTDYNYLTGINFDYKIKKKLRVKVEYVETSVRTRLFLARSNLNNNIGGHSINFSVGLIGFGNFIRMIEN